MQIAADAPRAARTIGGISVQVPQPFSEGYVLTAALAAMLNQTFSENISNNTRSKVVGEDGQPLDAAAFQAVVDEYVAAYEPGVRQGGGGGGGARTLSPVEKEVRNLATDKLKEILKGRGLKQSDVNFTELRDKIIAQHGDALRSQAEKVIRARERAAGDDSDILASVTADLVGGGEQPADAAEAPAAV